MKTEQKVSHTPGPWRVIRNPQYGWIITSANGRSRDDIVVVRDWPNPNGEANSNLIASAPVLLEVAKEALRYVRSKQNGGENWPHQLANLLCNAIEKSEGK